MVREPDTGPKTYREALQICRIRDERVLNEKQGVAWNFPAAKKGEVSFECRVDGTGVLVSLCDHWINPCDWAIRGRAVSSAPLTAETLGGPAQWRTVTVSWDLAAATVLLTCEGRTATAPLKTSGFSPFGVSYLHLQTLAESHDPKGTYFRWFKMRAAGAPKIVARRTDSRTGFEFYQGVAVKKNGKDNGVNLYVAGDLPVYFPIMNYNFGGWKSRPGYPEYAKLAKISRREAVERLLKLAKDCGGAGITMECVDYCNYSPDVCEAIRTFSAAESHE